MGNTAAGQASSAKRHGLRPDATIAIRLGRTEGTVFAEIDCGHEGADLQDKLNRYRKMLPQPSTELRLLTLGNEARLDEVARMCRRAEIDRSTQLFTRSDVVAQPAKPPVPKLFRKFEQQQREENG